jgi:hypothetical protein
VARAAAAGAEAKVRGIEREHLAALKGLERRVGAVLSAAQRRVVTGHTPRLDAPRPRPAKKPVEEIDEHLENLRNLPDRVIGPLFDLMFEAHEPWRDMGEEDRALERARPRSCTSGPAPCGTLTSSGRRPISRRTSSRRGPIPGTGRRR